MWYTLRTLAIIVDLFSVASGLLIKVAKVRQIGDNLYISNFSEGLSDDSLC